MRWSIVVMLVIACDAPDPCPGKLTCADHECCPDGFPYECNGACYADVRACTTPYYVCVAESGGGGTGGLAQYSGTYGGTCTSMDPGLPSQSMDVTLVVDNGTITSGAPNGGAVSADGIMSITVIDRLGTPFEVTGPIDLANPFTISGTTPDQQDATTVACTLRKQ